MSAVRMRIAGVGPSAWPPHVARMSPASRKRIGHSFPYLACRIRAFGPHLMTYIRICSVNGFFGGGGVPAKATAQMSISLFRDKGCV
jgi:hypothetical protein